MLLKNINSEWFQTSSLIACPLMMGPIGCPKRRKKLQFYAS